jgi:hypothetical protein
MPMRGLRIRYCGVWRVAAVAVTVLGTWRSARADGPPTFLEQLSAQTQQVYQQARVGIVRVQVPPPQWVQRINDQQRALDQQRLLIGTIVTTQPSGFVAPPSRELALFVIGLVVDGDGHVMLPVYVDPQAVGDGLMNVRMMDGTIAKAKLIGSDKQTNLTVVQLQQHVGKAVKLAAGRPEDGSLTLIISADGGARLSVWNNLHPDSGLVVLPDSSISGFGSNGQFLAATAVEPLVAQIIATRHVRRAVLGVNVHVISAEDPVRLETPQLGRRPAFMIDDVDVPSAAQRAGLRVRDLILAIDGQNVSDSAPLAAAITNRVGKTDLQILRGADVLTVTVDLQPQ